MAIDFNKHRHVPKISSVVALLAFLMPFFLIKCGDTVITDIKGYELLSGKSGIGASEDPDAAKDLNPNLFAFLGFASAVTLVILAWIKMKNKKILQVITAGVGFLSLILLFVSLTGSDISSDTGAYASMISIELSYGYYTCQLGFVISIVFHWLDIQNDRKNKIPSDDKIVDTEIT